MSELQPVAEQIGGTGEDGATRGGGGEGSRQGYWQVVGRAYWRPWINKVAAWWALLIVMLTVFVPFLANEAPYTALVKTIPVDAEGNPLPLVWVREFPLIRDLSRVDWIWLVWGLALAAGLVGKRWLSRRGDADAGRRNRAVLLGVVGGLAVAASISIALLKADYLDGRDYQAMALAGDMRSSVSAPLRWGYADAEPLELNRLFEYPSKAHVLGTDGNGRDALARLLWGARIVLEIGFVSELIALGIGVVYGALMGYFVGKVDLLGMRVVEVIESIPLLLLLITFVAFFGRQFFMLMVIIGVTGWTPIARFVRAEFLQLRQTDYVAAAKAMGLPLRNILFRHMLPNGLTPVIVTFTFGVAGNIVSESILSFLGIGVEPPTASWGAMLDEAGNPAETFRWWLAIAPGLMIFLTVFAYNIMGEGLRDAIDPKLNKLQ